MKRACNITLLGLIFILFILNSDICDHFYDSATETAEWWNLRFKFYSLMFTLLGLAVFTNAQREIKIFTIPLLAIFIGDLKDRVLFDDPQRHWSDILLVVISLLLMILLWQRNGKSRK